MNFDTTNDKLIDNYMDYFNKNRTQKISLVKKSFDPSGNIIKSKTKTVNSFVANDVHFLDATMCHYIINAPLNNKNSNSFKLATIHDCFFIQPQNEQLINLTYRQALLFAYNRVTFNKSVCKAI